jgi:hypothetical protein
MRCEVNLSLKERERQVGYQSRDQNLNPSARCAQRDCLKSSGEKSPQRGRRHRAGDDGLMKIAITVLQRTKEAIPVTVISQSRICPHSI